METYAAVLSQKLNPAVAQMIAEQVADFIANTVDMKRTIYHHITHYLCKDSHKTQMIRNTSQPMMT